MQLPGLLTSVALFSSSYGLASEKPAATSEKASATNIQNSPRTHTGYSPYADRDHPQNVYWGDSCVFRTNVTTHSVSS